MNPSFRWLRPAGEHRPARGWIRAAGATALAAALLVVAAGAVAQGGSSSIKKVPNVVLVHGLWADGSSWSGVIQRLQQAGYNVTAAQLGFSSLQADVATLRGILANQTGPTIVAAHSFGGAVMTELGTDAPNVVGLVYVAAFAPDQGETLKALAGAQPAPPGAAAFRPDANGWVWLDRDGFLKYFAPDVDPAQARVMAAEQKPAAGALLQDPTPLGPPLWKKVPSWFLVSENDQIVPPDWQRAFAKRMGATVSSIASSHVSLVSHPDVVADLITRAAEATGK